MSFCPSDPDFRIMLGKTLTEICHTDAQLEQLTRKLVASCREWPGIYEVRACACSCFKPKDGLQVDSVIYPDGFPSFAEMGNPDLAAIPAAKRRLDLPPSQQIEAQKQITAPYTEDPELEALVKKCAKPLPPRGPRTAEEIQAELYRRRPAGLLNGTVPASALRRIWNARYLRA